MDQPRDLGTRRKGSSFCRGKQGGREETAGSGGVLELVPKGWELEAGFV